MKDKKNDEIRKDSIALTEYLNRFSRNEKIVCIDRLVAGCLVPRGTIHNWMRGLARIPELHKRKIEEIVGESVFDSITICEK